VSYLVAQFPDARRAATARERLARESITVSEEGLARQTASEGGFMLRIVVIVVLASAAGTAIGAGLGAFFAFAIGPDGTSGYIIQMVSWAIFAHLLIGMWAGYALLADRSSREIGHGRPVRLTIPCANIDATALAQHLRDLGATKVDVREGAGSATR
jgi:hypothetical protein